MEAFHHRKWTHLRIAFLIRIMGRHGRKRWQIDNSVIWRKNMSLVDTCRPTWWTFGHGVDPARTMRTTRSLRSLSWWPTLTILTGGMSTTFRYNIQVISRDKHWVLTGCFSLNSFWTLISPWWHPRPERSRCSGSVETWRETRQDGTCRTSQHGTSCSK